jgi:signal transduction histidine kinase
MPLSVAMSERAALVLVRALDPKAASGGAESSRWRRRAPAAHIVSARPPRPPAAPRRERARPARAWVLGVLAISGAAWAALLVARAQLGDATFSGRIEAGCEELAPCQSLEAEAERRLERCQLFCGRAAAEYKAARLMRYRSEERRAVRDHYRERDRVERLAEEQLHAQKVDEWQRREAARAEQAAGERRERLELERLRQEHIDRRIADERQRRAAYYAALGPEGRALRLKRCLGNAEHCDGLVLDLLDAARDDAERRKLAELNEGVVPPPPPPAKPKRHPEAALAPSGAAAPSDPPAAGTEPASPREVAPGQVAPQRAAPSEATLDNSAPGDAITDRPST